MRIAPRGMRLVLFILAAISAVSALGGQTPPTDSVALARQLREANHVNEAARVLRAYLASHPDNGDAARLLSETLYWLKDVAGARSVAEASLAQHPDDVTLRLQFARMLAETGDTERARAVLEPALRGRDRARALSLLGTIDYWAGDWSSAARSFEAALQIDPRDAEARRQLNEIRSMAAPRLSLAVDALHDDQPIDAFTPSLQAVVYADPLTPTSVQASTSYFRLSDTASRTLSAAQLGVSTMLPSAHVRLGGSVGALTRSWGTSRGSSNDWTAVAFAELHATPAVTFAVRGDRAAYVSTVASLSTPVMVERATVDASLSAHNGWMGQAEAQAQRYPDANVVGNAFVWLLAPVVNERDGQFQIGYSASGQDSRELRYVLATQSPLAGRYAPYYTPRQVISHSAIAAARFGRDDGVALRLNGGYAVYASENAPGFVSGTFPSPRTSPLLTEFRRTFSPWNARASLGGPAATRWRWLVSAEAMHTAFYTAQSATLQLDYRLRD